MGCIIIEAPAALGLLRPPALPLGPQHHRAVGFGQHMGDAPQRPAVDHLLHPPEGAHEAVVIAHLPHQPARGRQLRQRLRLLRVQAEGFFAEHMQPPLQRGAHHRRMQPRRRGDHHRVRPGLLQHLVIAAEHPGRDISVQQADQEPGGLRCACLGIGVGVDDREMRQAHLTQADNTDPNLFTHGG